MTLFYKSDLYFKLFKYKTQILTEPMEIDKYFGEFGRALYMLLFHAVV